MGAGRRRSIGATVLCIAAVLAVPSELSAATPPATSTPVAAPSAALGPVTIHEIEPSAPARPAASTMTQVVTVAVIGGDLTLVTPQAEVELRRGPWSMWTGELPVVRVIDARGTHAGWTVRWSIAEVTAAAGSDSRDLTSASTVWLAPSDPVVVAGVPDGLTGGTSGWVLLAAEPGAGGGTYEAGGRVGVLVPPSLHPTAVVVRLTFTLG